MFGRRTVDAPFFESIGPEKEVVLVLNRPVQFVNSLAWNSSFKSEIFPLRSHHHRPKHLFSFHAFLCVLHHHFNLLYALRFRWKSHQLRRNCVRDRKIFRGLCYSSSPFGSSLWNEFFLGRMKKIASFWLGKLQRIARNQRRLLGRIESVVFEGRRRWIWFIFVLLIFPLAELFLFPHVAAGLEVHRCALTEVLLSNFVKYFFSLITLLLFVWTYLKVTRFGLHVVLDFPDFDELEGLGLRIRPQHQINKILQSWQLLQQNHLRDQMQLAYSMSSSLSQLGQTVILSLKPLLTIGIQKSTPVKKNKQTIQDIEVQPCLSMISISPVYSHSGHFGFSPASST